MTGAETLEFQSILERPEGTGTWTFAPIPIDLKVRFSVGGLIKVHGTIDGMPYRSTALPRGDGTHYLVVKSEIRERIHAEAGQVVTIVLERDLGERVVAVPSDFRQALDAKSLVGPAFDALASSHRKEFVEWIDAAKTEATRAKRIQSALSMIAEKSSPKRPRRVPQSDGSS